MRSLRIQLLIVFVMTTPLPGRSDELAVTEQLVRSEIIRLGGSWEAEADNKSPEMISFYGENFKERHFEMLEHVRSARAFASVGVDISPVAVVSIARLRNLEAIQIQEGSFSGEGCGKWQKLKTLTSLKVFECRLTCRGVRSIAKIQSLTTLSLNDVDLPEDALVTLGAMQNLKVLHIFASREIEKEAIEQLKSRLPDCRIKVEPVKKPEQ